MSEKLSRRDFLKYLSGAAGALALGGLFEPRGIEAQALTRHPTDAEMQKAFGFDRRGIKPVFTGTETDNAKWTLQAVEDHVFTQVPFPKDWQLTITKPDGTVEVYYGDGQPRDIMGATFRHLPSYDANYWVRDPKDLIAHEFNFGWAQGRDPRYVTLNGNLDVPEWQDFDGSTCPVNVVQTAGLAGGSYKNWTKPDWEGGAWTFKGETNQFYLLTASQVPGNESWIDYWNGQKGAVDKLTNWASLALNEASFHCHPAK